MWYIVYSDAAVPAAARHHAHAMNGSCQFLSESFASYLRLHDRMCCDYRLTYNITDVELCLSVLCNVQNVFKKSSLTLSPDETRFVIRSTSWIAVVAEIETYVNCDSFELCVVNNVPQSQRTILVFYPPLPSPRSRLSCSRLTP